MALKYNNSFEYMDEAFLDDRDFILEAERINPFLVDELESMNMLDREILVEALKVNGEVIAEVNETYLSDRELVLLAVRQNGLALEHIANYFSDDYEVVSEAIKNEGCAIQFASPRLKSDKQLISMALSNNPIALNNTDLEEFGLDDDEDDEDDDIFNSGGDLEEDVKIEEMNNEFFYPQIRIIDGDFNNMEFPPQYLDYAPQNINVGQLTNKHEVVKVVRMDGLQLQLVSEVFKNDQDVVINAVLENAMAIQYASPICRDNETVVLTAVRKNEAALQFASPRLRNCKDFLNCAVSINGLALQYVDPLHIDERLIMVAVTHNGLALVCIPNQFKTKHIVMQALSQNGLALELVPSMNNDRDIVEQAIRQNGLAYRLASDTLKHDKSLFALALKVRGDKLAPIYSRSNPNHQQDSLSVVLQFLDIIREAPIELLSDTQFVKESMKKAVFPFHPNFKLDDQIVMNICRNNQNNSKRKHSDGDGIENPTKRKK